MDFLRKINVSFLNSFFHNDKLCNFWNCFTAKIVNSIYVFHTLF